MFMKRIYFLLCFILLQFSGIAQISSNGTGGGDWHNVSTWAGGVIPQAGDEVIIVDGDIVNVTTTENASSITVNGTDVSNYGTLKIATGAVLSTSSHTTVYGNIEILGGEFNEGDSSGDKLTINGSNLGSSCLFKMSGGTLNIVRYFTLSNSSSFEMIGGVINVNSAGGSSSTDILYIPSGTIFTMSSGTINILNGNLGSGVALRFNPTTSNVTGGVINFTNVKSYSSTTAIISNNLDSIASDVKATNVFHIQNMPSDNSGFSMKSFTITSGTVQIDTETKINITDYTTLGADDKLTLASGASVIFGTAPTEKITVQRTLTNSAWHYISPAVNDTRQFSANSSLNLVSGDFFYRFDETLNDGTWVQIYPTGGSGAMTEQFTAGQGYALEYNNGDNTISFNGTIRTGNVVYDLSKTGSLAYNGFNLTGNPYQVTIIANNDANSLLAENLTRLDATYSALYFWNQVSSDYTSINNSDTKTRIAVGQGFMVRSKSNGETFTYKTSMQENGTNTFYKNTEQDSWVRSWFNLTNGQDLTNDILIAFGDGMTDGLDIGFDAGKFKGNSNIALYSLLVDNSQDVAFSTQALPSFLSSPVSIKIGFDIAQTGEFTFSMKDISFYSDSIEIEKVSIELEDKYLNSVTDLKNNVYSFYATDAGTFADRFVLHFNRNVLSVKNPSLVNAAPFQIYSRNDNKIVIKRTDNKGVNSSMLRITDIQGRILHEEWITLVNGEVYFSKPINTSGIVFVSIASNENVTTKKVLLK